MIKFLQNGKVIGVAHAVSVGVSAHPVSEKNLAPGAPESLRISAFIAKGCAEYICRLRNIPFTTNESDRYYYVFDPLESDRQGQSAGVALTIGTLSKILNRRPIDGLCATGQITNNGLLIRVGGLKQKVRAAKALGMKKIVLPKSMESDFNNLKEKDKKGLEPIFAEYLNDIFDIIFPAEPVFST
uniref:Lon proteolytic domain-containing protein n=1 Tax=Meloidogyne incognita TaxID=6306 RepID=A0A914LPC6_MELIC